MAGSYIRTPEHRKMMSEKFKGRDCYWSRGKKRPPFSKKWIKNMSLARKNNKECIKNLGIWAGKDRPYRAVDIKGKKNPNWKGRISIDKSVYESIRYRTNPKYNLNRRIKGLIGLSLKGNKAGRHWESLVDYTLNDLIKRLNNTMPVGYTWKDFLTGKLQIDHIIPKKVFNFTKPEHTDFKRCWALSNLRLLPAKENLNKAAKLFRPFQPALKIYIKGAVD